MSKRRQVKYIHAGKYAAEVDVELIEDETEWSPYLSLEDAEKIENVRAALERGDVATASKQARVFTLHPVASSL